MVIRRRCPILQVEETTVHYIAQRSCLRKGSSSRSSNTFLQSSCHREGMGATIAVRVQVHRILRVFCFEKYRMLFCLRARAINLFHNADLGRDGNLEAHWSRILVRVHTTIDRNERRLADQDNREKTELEWKQVALVSDRALLCVFFLTTIISTAVILSGSPPPIDVTNKG